MRQLKITKSITNRESASLDKYLQEIGREELVSPEEEVELARESERVIREHWRNLLVRICDSWFLLRNSIRIRDSVCLTLSMKETWA